MDFVTKKYDEDQYQYQPHDRLRKYNDLMNHAYYHTIAAKLENTLG